MFHLIETANAAGIESAQDLTQLVTPYLPFAGTILGAAVVGAFALWNRKRGNFENRAPDVNEIWQQQASQSKQLDIERTLRRMLQDLVYDLKEAFRLYVYRVQSGGSKELTHKESQLLYKDSPTPESLLGPKDPKSKVEE